MPAGVGSGTTAVDACSSSSLGCRTSTRPGSARGTRWPTAIRPIQMSPVCLRRRDDHTDAVCRQGLSMSIEDLLDKVDGLPPGPDLGDVLAGIDARALTGTQLVELFVARQRQLCFEQAHLLVAVAG